MGKLVGEIMRQAIFGCPARNYDVVNPPQHSTIPSTWPIPAPAAIREALDTPLQGLWIDHVPTGAEIAAMKLLCTGKPERAQRHPLATGDWSDARYALMLIHPEWMGPQIVMPDAWFDHAEARRPPPQIDDDYEPESGETVATVIGHGMSGSGNKHEAAGLPALWRQGLLRTAEERMLANEVLTAGWAAPASLWYQIILDEGWTIRRAAQVLREAGVDMGEVCAWTNRWARRPAAMPASHDAPLETAFEVHRRCIRQLADDGTWPLARTAEIAAAHEYRRVE